MAPVNAMRVEVVFALPDRQKLVALQLEQGSTIANAIACSGIENDFPDVDLHACEVAVWGIPAGRDRILREGDRVEILRPLEIDPRQARRRLAEVGQVMGGAGKKRR